MSDEIAHLVALAIRRTDQGSAAFGLETPFGEKVQVMPRPPRYQATATFAWDGAMPDEVAALVARAREAGIRIDEQT
jgi:hypothetical protein